MNLLKINSRIILLTILFCLCVVCQTLFAATSKVEKSHAIGSGLPGGTAGSVLFVGTGGTLAQDNSNLFWDDANNRLGIGSTSPLDALHIQTASNNYGWRHTDGTITVGSYVGSSAGWIGTRSNHPLQFFTNNSSAQLILNTSGNLTIGATAPTHTLTIPSAGTGLAIYNTADQTTNYERVVGSWSSNVFSINTTSGGTGTTRAIRIGQSSNYTQHQVGAFPYSGWVLPNTGSAGTVSSISGGTFTNSSGTMVYFSLTPTYSQTGTAGSADLYINRTNTALGSGVHSYLRGAIAGTIQYDFKVNGPVRYVPSSSQTLSAGTATLANAAIVKVQGNGGAVTITATPSIADGEEGDTFCIQGQHSTNTVTYQDQGTLASSNLRLGATGRTLAGRDSLCLEYDGTDWVETSFSNVI